MVVRALMASLRHAYSPLPLRRLLSGFRHADFQTLINHIVTADILHLPVGSPSSEPLAVRCRGSGQVTNL